MNKTEYLEKEAKEWVEDFFGEEKSPSREVEDLWVWTEDDYEENPPLNEEEYYRLVFSVKDALLNGTPIPTLPEIIHERVYETMHGYSFRRVEPALLEQYKSELADDETKEKYNELIGNISAKYLKLVERLNRLPKAERE